MRLRTFSGSDLATAMAAVRRALGDEALILETREARSGIEILAAANPRPEPVPSVPFPLPRAENAPAPREPDTSGGLRDSLMSHGLSDLLARRLLADDLTEALSATIGFGRLPLEVDAPPILFVGEPGAGKTLSVIKTAARLVLGGATPPLVISTDERKAGAIEQLASMTRLLGLTLIVARDPDQLRRALSRRREGAPVLIDTPGLDSFAPADRGLLSEMRDATEGTIVLVLPAGLDVGEASETALSYAALGTRRMIASRLDIARRLGGIVEPAFRANLVLTEAGTGADVSRDFVRLTPLFLAERLRATTRAPPSRAGARPSNATLTHRPATRPQETDRYEPHARSPAPLGSA